MKKIISFLIAIIMLAAPALAASPYHESDGAPWHPVKFEWEPISSDGVVARFAIGADVHYGVGGNFSDDKMKTVYEALGIFGGVDALCLVGDVNNYGTPVYYEPLMKTVRANSASLPDDVEGFDNSAAGDSVGVTLISMGNHESYEMGVGCWDVFRECVGQEPTKLYYVAGIPVVKMSPDDLTGLEKGSNTYHAQEAEILAMFDLIDASGYTGPIIGLSHHRVPTSASTVSNDTWTEAELNCFKAHPNLILFTGHSHTNYYDTRQFIEQDLGFTMVRSGVLGTGFGGDFVSPNSGQDNGNTTFNDADDSCCFVLADVLENGTVRLRRVNIAKGEIVFPDEDFIIDPSSDFRRDGGDGKVVSYYSRSHNKGNYGYGRKKAVFPEDSEITVSVDGSHDAAVVTFPAASPATALARDYIVEYQVVFTGPEGTDPVSISLMNDGYLAVPHETWTVPVIGLLPDTDYTVKVNAVTAYRSSTSLDYDGVVNVGHVDPREATAILSVDASEGSWADACGRQTVVEPSRLSAADDKTIGKKALRMMGVGAIGYEFSPDEFDAIRTDYSLEAYFKTNDTEGPAFVLGSVESLNTGLRVEDGKLWFYGRYRSTEKDLMPYVIGVDIDAGVWYHAAATYDGTTARLYLDGEPVGERKISGGLLEPGFENVALCVGGASSGPESAVSYKFSGLINEAKIFTGVLTPEQIKSDFEKALKKNADAVFSDVTASDWFAPYVNYAYKNGLMNGVSASLFDPEGDMNRAMIVTVLWRTEGTPAPSGAPPFDDLSEDWYRDAVVWAAENGIVNGTGKGKFSPDDPLTREQIAAIMMRFSAYKGYDVSARADISSFPDASKVDGYAVDPMRWAVGSGLITGSAQNGAVYLDPLGHATRAQVATVLQRYLESDKGGATLTVDRGGRALLSEFVASSPVGKADDLSAGAAALCDFAVRLFREAGEPGTNTLVSPLSVYTALAMTQNGARGDTLAQMEKTLGTSAADVNRFLYTLTDSFGEGDGAELTVANSVWFTTSSRFEVNRNFLKTNADWYGADIFAAPFDDRTLNDINGWVSGKTDGMIEKILDEIPSNAIMYLINTVCFEAEWAHKYEQTSVKDGVFTNSDGSTSTALMMRSEEGFYFEDGDAVGFVKYYAGGKYAFAAILPGEGVAPEEYAATLDGARLRRILENKRSVRVEAYLPKFETEFDAELSAVLMKMGMVLPFNEDFADLSGIGRSAAGNLYISRVLHKTFITLNETGTKAGAAAVVEISDKNASPWGDGKTVRLDRPFLYMIIDTETNVPIFIGSVNRL